MKMIDKSESLFFHKEGLCFGKNGGFVRREGQEIFYFLLHVMSLMRKVKECTREDGEKVERIVTVLIDENEGAELPYRCEERS